MGTQTGTGGDDKVLRELLDRSLRKLDELGEDIQDAALSQERIAGILEPARQELERLRNATDELGRRVSVLEALRLAGTESGRFGATTVISVLSGLASFGAMIAAFLALKGA